MNLREIFEDQVELPDGEFDYWLMYSEFVEDEFHKLLSNISTIVNSDYMEEIVNLHRDGVDIDFRESLNFVKAVIRRHCERI
jgi:hypothetical protein